MACTLKGTLSKSLLSKSLLSKIIVGIVAISGLAGSALGQFSLRTQSVATGLSRPLYVTAPPGDFARLFVVEQRSGTIGRIRIVNLPANSLNATPFLSVSPVSTSSEQGLLGLAFHPDFLNNGYFWINYTLPAQSGISAGSTRIVRYRANLPYATSTTAAAASATTVLEIRQPENNHNGGWISFGPDGNLYVAMGDGGCFNDQNSTQCGSVFNHSTGGNAQDITDNLLGKMLRLDVDGLDNIPGNADDDAFPADATRLYSIPTDNPFVGISGDDEIWMYGLRNSWRNTFDRATGDFWIADVGQDAREEVNFVPFGQGSAWNMGWRCLEGTRSTGLSGCSPSDPTLRRPILEYGHTTGTAIGPTTILGCSITGGIVYRGASVPCFQGHYIFADYCTGDIWSFRRDSGGAVANLVNRTIELDPPGSQIIQNVVSFGEDASGEMYIVDQTGGEVFRVFVGGSGDCNANNIIDSCEIAAGLTPDVNANGIPDSCETTVCNDIDVNNDGASFDPQDIEAFLSIFSEGPCVPATQTCDDIDFNNDAGLFDPCDISSFLAVFSEGPCTACGQ